MTTDNDLAAAASAHHKRRAIGWLVGFWLLLVSLTHVPSPFPKVGEPDHFDKVVHFSLYGTLGLLALHALTVRAANSAAMVRCVGIFAAVTAFGLFDEATQPLTGRDFDWFDWLADGVGVLAGIALYEAVRRRRTLHATSKLSNKRWASETE
ncbi:MAG TPA: VanZ family protein [Pirellulales bacterium]|nr:VanZ family protein [Pirellulales bacterium]